MVLRCADHANGRDRAAGHCATQIFGLLLLFNFIKTNTFEVTVVHDYSSVHTIKTALNVCTHAKQRTEFTMSAFDDLMDIDGPSYLEPNIQHSPVAATTPQPLAQPVIINARKRSHDEYVADDIQQSQSVATSHLVTCIC